MTRRSTPALAAVIAVLLAGGVASAYMTATGTGAAAAATATMGIEVVAFAGGDAPSAQLVPGGTADTVVRVTNPNAFAVVMVAVEPNGTVTADAAHPGCVVTGVTFTAPAAPAITVEPGTELVHLAGTAAMDATSDSACQGATFDVPVTVTVRR